jgi:hypothetical protein
MRAHSIRKKLQRFEGDRAIFRAIGEGELLAPRARATLEDAMSLFADRFITQHCESQRQRELRARSGDREACAAGPRSGWIAGGAA